MNYSITLLFVASVTLTLSNTAISTEQDFEINKENCNLTMEKVRQLLPSKKDQQKAQAHCMQRAIEERWGNNLKQPQNTNT